MGQRMQVRLPSLTSLVNRISWFLHLRWVGGSPLLGPLLAPFPIDTAWLKTRELEKSRESSFDSALCTLSRLLSHHLRASREFQGLLNSEEGEQVETWAIDLMSACPLYLAPCVDGN
jgi:hypothetical protein